MALSAVMNAWQRVNDLSTWQKVAVVVAIPTSGVFIYLMFRSNDEDPLPEKKIVASKHRVIEVKVPRKAVGAIIGTEGSQIKQIQDVTGARVNFKDDYEEHCTERVLTIRGSAEQTQQAEMLVLKIVADIPPIIEETFYVPRRCLGRIIGKGGETIRKISKDSRAKIWIDRENKTLAEGDMKDITIKGTPHAVVNAKDRIEELLQQDEDFRARMALNQANRPVRNHSSKVKGDPHSSSTQALVMNDAYKARLSEWPFHNKNYLDMYISAVESPEHFWVQLITAEAPKLDQLTDNMTRYYATVPKSTLAFTFKEGDFVATPFEGDNSLYRARVLEVLEDKVDVYFVDYGDSEFVPKSQVYPLNNEFLHLPFQAFECCVDGIEPKDKEWTEQSLEDFEALVYVAQWKVIQGKHCGMKTKEFYGDLHSLKLIDTNQPFDLNIGEELVKRGYAKHSQEPDLSNPSAASPPADSYLQKDLPQATASAPTTNTLQTKVDTNSVPATNGLHPSSQDAISSSVDNEDCQVSV